MANQTSLDVRPVSTTHLDIDHFALGNRDLQIKDTATPTHLLKLHCWSKDRFLNHAKENNLLESNLPKYTFLEVHHFPYIVHYCQACYVPSQRAIVARN